MRRITRNIIALLLFVSLLATPIVQAMGESAVIPEITLVQQPVPDNEAIQFLRRVGVGWNLGNTFDAYKSEWNKNADEMTVEKSWCGVYTTQPMIQAIHDAGFTAIRIPVSWHDHITQNGQDYIISEKWLNRVQEVVDWAIALDMYVIVNTHHDEDYIYPTNARLQASLDYLTSVWTQVARRFADYDEHLIFESLNEPRLVGTAYEWNFNKAIVQCQQAAECLNVMNQAFVDTVRATGGNNASRYLMVPGYCASPASVLNEYFRLPTDSADNKIIVSVHAYTPYNFALQALSDGGIKTFDLDKPAQRNEIINFVDSLYKRYTAQGIPVIIGEFGARDKGNLQDRVNFAAYYAAVASSRCLPVFLWDNNAFSGNGENFGMLRRRDCSWPFPDIVKALIQYGGYDRLPPKQ